jgi:antitoxin MazE
MIITGKLFRVSGVERRRQEGVRHQAGADRAPANEATGKPAAMDRSSQYTFLMMFNQGFTAKTWLLCDIQRGHSGSHSMRTQIGKWGNGLAVRIPGTCAKDLDLTEGMELEVSLVEGGILLRPLPREYNLDGLVSRITPDNTHAETSWGEARGREAW